MPRTSDTIMSDGKPIRNKTVIISHSGHKLTTKEDAFIDEFIKTGNAAQSVLAAGYKTKNPYQISNNLKQKIYIQDEIDYRLSTLKSQRIADATEILEYFSSVMRGEIRDQFDMEASLAERTKAAQELAKRQIDMVSKTQQNDTPELKITLDFSGTDEKPLQTVKDVMGDVSDIKNMVDNLINADAKEKVAEVVDSE